jgi:hypothetical protein
MSGCPEGRENPASGRHKQGPLAGGTSKARQRAMAARPASGPWQQISRRPMVRA